MAAHLSWTVHRAKETPVKTVVASIFILGFVAFSSVVFGPVLGVLALIVLFVALNAYFLPITYTLTDKGIEVDKRMFSTRYEWKQFRRWFRTTGGIVISPFSRKNYLDNFRGVHLLLPAGSSRVTSDECRVTNDGQRTEDGARMASGECRVTNEGQRTEDRAGMASGEWRMANDGQRMPDAVRTEDIVAYLEKRFAPPPPDERLTLD